MRGIRHMLKQQEGFTLMELMIVVVIIGVLAGIAIPTYKGIESRARQAVGDANAEMLNRGVQQLVYFGKIEKQPYNGLNEVHENLLLDFLGIEKGRKLKYVVWRNFGNEEFSKIGGYYEGVDDPNASIPRKPPYQLD